MRAAATAVLILLFVQGCVFPVGYCTRSEAPEVTQEQSTRDDVVAVLGEPYATTEVQGRSIDVYDYDGVCAGAWFVGIPIPQWRDKPGVLVVKYLDDTLVWAGLVFDTTPGRVVVVVPKAILRGGQTLVGCSAEPHPGFLWGNQSVSLGPHGFPVPREGAFL